MPYADGIVANELTAVRELMRHFVYPYVTPISSSLDLITGECHGTGNFVSLRGFPYILTNDHFPELGLGRILCHFVGNDRPVVRISFPFVGSPPPVDAAIARIEIGALDGGDRMVAPSNLIEEQFDVVPGEIMFFQGYPIATGEFDELNRTLNARALSLVTDLYPARP
jgi:hypothetical protein